MIIMGSNGSRPPLTRPIIVGQMLTAEKSKRKIEKRKRKRDGRRLEKSIIEALVTKDLDSAVAAASGKSIPLRQRALALAQKKSRNIGEIPKKRE